MIAKTKPTNLETPIPRIRLSAAEYEQLILTMVEQAHQAYHGQQLPIIDLASLDPVKRQAEEARRRALLAQAQGIVERKGKTQ